MTLEACEGCGTLNRPGACACLGCGAKLRVCSHSPALAVRGLALAGCVGLKDDIAQPAYGVAISGLPDSAEDGDGDGFSTAQGDCNDDDETVFPGAEDPAGDGLDTNCDGVDG